MQTRKYKIGDRYGQLTILKLFRSLIGNKGRWIYRAKCKCDCGKIAIIIASHLGHGHTRSCGCLWIKTMTKHGHAYSPVYKTWNLIKRRCLDKKDKRYLDYGGRGIGICKEWLNFKNFLADMGEKPKGKSIDRIDNNKGYCKENCHWATPHEQQNNMRSNIVLEYNGKRMTLAQWAKRLKFPYGTLQARIKRNWTIQRALTQKIQ